jgi:glycerate 2-kinase
MTTQLFALEQLRQTALNIFNEVIKGVDTNKAVKETVRLDGPRLLVKDQVFDLERQSSKIYAIAIGKGAFQMASALDQILDHKLTAGVATGPMEDSKLPEKRWHTFTGGHPTPNKESLAAAQAAFDILREADQTQAIVIFLISGGGSAMLEWPCDERISLEDLCKANQILVTCGASIGEINAVRRSISAIKGGKLSTYAPNTKQISLIISDTQANEEFNVASGPTIPPTHQSPSALDIVTKYDLKKELPQTVVMAIENSHKKMDNIHTSTAHQYYVLLDNKRAIDLAVHAAKQNNLTVEVAEDLIEQHVEKGCQKLISRLFKLRQENSLDHPVCLISGGEFACPVKGSGTGGRNLETVLRLAISIDQLKTTIDSESHIVCLSCGTDGIDGNSPAAGAICDETSIARAQSLELDAMDYLNRSDSYTFFNSLGDTISPGKTGTNVRDIRIAIYS